MARAALVVLVAAASSVVVAPHAAGVIPTEIPTDDTWVTNGRVWSVVEAGDHVYLGGNFTTLGPNTGRAVMVDDTAGLVLPGSPKINGPVYDAVDDGNGGFYVVGAFDNVNGVSRGRGAHIRSDGSVGPFNPGANGSIREIVRIGVTLLVGGDFTTVQSIPRSRLALLGPLGGPVASWVTDANGTVDELVLSADGSRVFVGGGFTSIAGMARQRVASLVTATGALEPWAPVVNGTVSAIAPSGSQVFLGGAFTSVNFVPRQRLAVVDYASGFVDPIWAANADGPVNALAVREGVLYVGGTFGKLKGTTRMNAGAVTIADASVTGWNPVANQAVHTIVPASDGSDLYLGGAFTSVRFVSKLRVARVDPVSGFLVGGLDPRPSAQVWVIRPTAGALLLGGDFASVGVVQRAYLARLDRSTGALDTTFNPSVNGPVEAMDLSSGGGRLYLGGRFTRVNGQPRNLAAAIHVPSGLLHDFAPSVSGVAVQAIDHRGVKVAIGGQFTSVNGTPLRNAARLDDESGDPEMAWAPNPDKQVRDVDILIDGSVILAGDFTIVGAVPMLRPYVAEINPLTATPTAWSPNPSNFVYEGVLSSDGQRYYAAVLGPGGGGGNAVEAFNASGAGARLWRTSVNGDVQAIALSPDESTLYAGGHFGTVYVGDTSTVLAVRDRMMAVKSSNGGLLPWRPRLDTNGVGVFAVTATANGLYIGGDFARVGPTSSQGLALFPGTP